MIIISFRLISNYILWRVVKKHYVQLSKDYTNMYKNYFILSYKFFPESTRQERCIDNLYDNFGMPISKLYLDKRFNGKSKTLVSIYIIYSTTILRSRFVMFVDRRPLVFLKFPNCYCRFATRAISWNFENTRSTVKLNTNFTLPHAITYT
jgi:hypothetical protein